MEITNFKNKKGYYEKINRVYTYKIFKNF